MIRSRLTAALWLTTGLALANAPCLSAQTTTPLTLRGRSQVLHLYGPRAGDPVVVASGDGGWIHLAPHVSEMLAAKGFFVVGLDTRAYLESFTTAKTTLQPADEPGDFQVLADFAGRATARKPLLVGVSEGAGLAVLAATDANTRSRIAGVVGLGLPDLNELGWRWKDMVTYVTHANPDEPMFSTAALVGKVAPTPLAAIHSTHDEFVSIEEVQRVMTAAKEPKRLWVVNASDHRFSDNLAEFDRSLTAAIAWIRENAAP